MTGSRIDPNVLRSRQEEPVTAPQAVAPAAAIDPFQEGLRDLRRAFKTMEAVKEALSPSNPDIARLVPSYEFKAYELFTGLANGAARIQSDTLSMNQPFTAGANPDLLSPAERREMLVTKYSNYELSHIAMALVRLDSACMLLDAKSDRISHDQARVLRKAMGAIQSYTRNGLQALEDMGHQDVAQLAVRNFTEALESHGVHYGQRLRHSEDAAPIDFSHLLRGVLNTQTSPSDSPAAKPSTFAGSWAAVKRDFHAVALAKEDLGRHSKLRALEIVVPSLDFDVADLFAGFVRAGKEIETALASDGKQAVAEAQGRMIDGSNYAVSQITHTLIKLDAAFNVLSADKSDVARHHAAAIKKAFDSTKLMMHRFLDGLAGEGLEQMRDFLSDRFEDQVRRYADGYRNETVERTAQILEQRAEEERTKGLGEKLYRWLAPGFVQRAVSRFSEAAVLTPPARQPHTSEKLDRIDAHFRNVALKPDEFLSLAA